MKLKLTRDDYYCYNLIPDEIDYEDMTIEVTSEQKDRIVLAFAEFSAAQDLIEEIITEGLAEDRPSGSSLEN